MEHATPFSVDRSLLKAVAEQLADKRHVYWLLGASCTGKTTVRKCLASNNVAGCCC
ncbi:MAG: hypothetical protein JW888_03705 [Pirellulales bacterium]|nr:hypothetical protein [Pirellulales bacterium]